MLGVRRRSLLVLVVGLAGCGGTQASETGLTHGSGASTPTHAGRSARSRASAGRSAPRRFAFPGPSRAHSAVVTQVTDGDTVSLGGIGKVRLIGIDTPEVYGHSECYGRAASAFTKRVLAPGTRVEYRLGVERRDRYGRALAYVWLADGRMFNGMLAEEGYATPLTIAPNVDYAGLFVAAARRARLAGRGLWAKDTCNGVNPPNRTSASGGGPVDHDCADFETQAEAQRYFDSHGGSPANNVERLDGPDRDGRVCESLP